MHGGHPSCSKSMVQHACRVMCRLQPSCTLPDVLHPSADGGSNSLHAPVCCLVVLTTSCRQGKPPPDQAGAHWGASGALQHAYPPAGMTHRITNQIAQFKTPPCSTRRGRSGACRGRCRPWRRNCPARWRACGRRRVIAYIASRVVKELSEANNMQSMKMSTSCPAFTQVLTAIISMPRKLHMKPQQANRCKIDVRLCANFKHSSP